MKRDEHIKKFVPVIWRWFSRHKRELPWRDLKINDDTSRAYCILVSEVMLQQTQVSRVRVKYKEFLELFPTLESLSQTSNRDILLAWRGMGYNSRALRLRDAAKIIQTEFAGNFPREIHELLSIKGIGNYTAAAIRNFAFHLPTPCLDTNIRRIFHRSFFGPENSNGEWRTSDRELMIVARDVLNEALKHDSYTTADWHAALMDYGALVCTKRNPQWKICPLTKSGLMKAAYKVHLGTREKAQEPGRFVGSTFIPNRIFRGRIVEELLDEKRGLSLNELGQRVCIDWSEKEHAKWLQSITEKLISETLLTRKRERFVLTE